MHAILVEETEFVRLSHVVQSEWCRYIINPVATTLRPAYPMGGVTSDMVMPIFPNTEYAKGREPLRADPAFPFSNCYFWICARTPLRIRAKPGGFYDTDIDKGIELPIPVHMEFCGAWEVEFSHMCELLDNLSSTGES